MGKGFLRKKLFILLQAFRLEDNDKHEFWEKSVHAVSQLFTDMGKILKSTIFYLLPCDCTYICFIAFSSGVSWGIGFMNELITRPK